MLGLDGSFVGQTQCGPNYWRGCEPSFQALHKHLGTEVRSLKAAIRQRDTKIAQLESKLQTEHEEAASSIESYNQQISALKGALLHSQVLLCCIDSCIPLGVAGSKSTKSVADGMPDTWLSTNLGTSRGRS